MKVIIGLGNPGENYKNSRHNIGFQVIDLICKEYEINLNVSKFGGVFFVEKDVIFAKPLNFMNKSGSFVKDLMNFYKVEIEDILVIYDDLDSELGQAKIKTFGSSGGHNGMKDIINKLGTDEIKRLKIGIGRPTDSEKIEKYVLDNIPYEDSIILDKVKAQSSKAAISFVYNDIRLVINSFNAKK
ncbi:MAG: aminoacyl-tRNA hydrolase [Mycoplasmataceae bacterium]|nr:aminoacyl-tRNA hydrolase [Mycoplasmataceae bacterium]